MPTVTSPRGLRRVRTRAFEIEAALLRASVDALSAGRFVCRDCRRTPLVGERVHLYEGRRGPDAVCELCRPQRASEPDRSELVRAAEPGLVTQVAQRA